MKELAEFPEAPKRGRTVDRSGTEGLSIPQLRVLKVLEAAKGPLSRVEISRRCGNKTVVVVSRAVGYSDPAKRAVFEKTRDGGGTPDRPFPSLLTLGYVREEKLDIDGLTEVAIELTGEGRKVLRRLRTVELPPLRVREDDGDEDPGGDE